MRLSGISTAKPIWAMLSRMPEQTALPLSWPVQQDRAHFIVSPCNHEAFERVTDPAHWPHAVLNITGPQASGKSHLAHIFADENNGFVIQNMSDLTVAIENDHAFYVIDNVDKILENNRDAQEKLFFLYNMVFTKNQRLLLTMSRLSEEWVVLPDLLSRLNAAQHVFLNEPDDDMVGAAYQKLFMDRGLTVDEQTLTFLVYRSERRFAFIQALVDKLDQLALEQGKRLTRPFVASVLDQLT